MISFDVKSLYTNVPLKQASEIALQKMYSYESPPEIQRVTRKRLLNTGVINVHFKCNNSWYVQVNGLGKGAFLAGIWLKEYDFVLKQEKPAGTGMQTADDLTGLCPCCSRKVTFRWMRNNPKLLPSKMREKSDDAGASITEIVWFCENWCLAKNYEKDTPQVKLFLVYVDDTLKKP